MNCVRSRVQWIVLLCLFAVLALSATTVFAQGRHIRESVPAGEDWFVPVLGEPGGVCSFPVQVHFDRAKAFNQYFFDGNGELTMVRFEGNVVIVVTNLETEQSVVRNISGPGSWDPATSIQAMSGPWIFWWAPDDPYFPSSSTGLYIHTGYIGVDFSGSVAQILRDDGKREDLCVTLAPH